MAGLVVFTLSFCLYAATASPSLGWLDSPGFIAASQTLGIAQAPGHPAVSLLGYLGGLIPVGDMAFRVNLVSAVAGACAVTALWWLTRTLGHWILAGADPNDGGTEPASEQSRRLSTKLADISALGTAAVCALSSTLWIEAGRTEVYALQAALIFGAIGAAITWHVRQSTSWLLVASGFAMLAAINHPFIAVVSLLPIAIWILSRKPGMRAVVLSIAIMLVAGLLLSYLPLRASQSPDFNFGNPSTWEQFVWVITAQAFQGAGDYQASTTGMQQVVLLLYSLGDHASLVLLVLAVFGAGQLLRAPRSRHIMLSLYGIIAMSLIGRYWIGFESDTADHHAYLIPAAGVAAALGALRFALLVHWVSGRLQRAAPRPNRASWQRPLTWAFTGIFTVVTLGQGLLHADAASHRRDYAPTRFANWQLRDLPPRAVVLTSYFQTSYRLAAARAVYNERPDLAVLDLGFLTFPGTAAHDAQRYPTLRPLLERGISLHRLPLDAVAALDRVVYVELFHALDANARARLIPSGALARIAARQSSTAELKQAALATQIASARLAKIRATSPTSFGFTLAADNVEFQRDFVYCLFHSELGVPRPADERCAELRHLDDN